MMIDVGAVLSLFTNSSEARLSVEHRRLPQTQFLQQRLVLGHVVLIYASHLPFLYLTL